MIVLNITISKQLLMMSTDTSYKILYLILNQLDMNNNIWISDKINKNEICSNLNISLNCFDKQLKSLKDRNILISTGKGRYTLNKIKFYL